MWDKIILKKNKIDNVDMYISQFPLKIQEILHKIRMIIYTRVPDNIENISYGIPAYKTNKKPLVYFAAYKNHIGFYPTPSGINYFKEELSLYKISKGSVQFPLNKNIPFDLIEKIIQQRVKENTLI